MFVKASIFKRVVKNMYKHNCLQVGNDGNNYVICNDNGFYVREAKDNMPKKIKAALVELIGDMPEQGSLIEYGEDVGQQNLISDFEAIEEPLSESAIEAHVTGVTINGAAVVQINDTYKCMTAGQMMLSMIDGTERDSTESVMTGPYVNEEYSYLLHYASNQCHVIIPMASPPEDTWQSKALQLLSKQFLE